MSVKRQHAVDFILPNDALNQADNKPRQPLVQLWVKISDHRVDVYEFVTVFQLQTIVVFSVGKITKKT